MPKGITPLDIHDHLKSGSDIVLLLRPEQVEDYVRYRLSRKTFFSRAEINAHCGRLLARFELQTGRLVEAGRVEEEIVHYFSR